LRSVEHSIEDLEEESIGISKIFGISFGASYYVAGISTGVYYIGVFMVRYLFLFMR